MVHLTIKNKLKAIRWLAKSNAWWKNRQARRIYTNTIRYYADRPLSDSFEILLSRRPSVWNGRSDNEDRKPNIFYLGTDELQDRSGILQTLEQFGRLTYFTQPDGKYGQYIVGTDEQRRSANASRIFEIFKSLHASGKPPDILIAQTFACIIDPRVFGQIAEMYGTLIVNIAMDDRHQYWGQKIDGGWGGASFRWKN